MTERIRPYVFYDTAVSVCSQCLRRCEAKVLFQDGRVLLDKRCRVHGRERTLLADDVDYYRRCREVFLKAPEMPQRFNTPARWGCPYDCGLCPDHMQHSCLSLIEITDQCNLECPICYAESGPDRQGFVPLATVERMLDAVVANEGEPDVVQISGGEPTLHPDLFAILDAARARPIRHLMLNTNGLRLAREPGFASRLAEYQPGFAVYLQLDSLREGAVRRLSGANLVADRLRALDALDRADLSTTLVVTLERGLNDDEIGGIVDFAIERPCVRGVTLQPIQAAGRLEGHDPARHRLTLSEVRRRLGEQSGLFDVEDVVPVPCNPDCLAMAYALKGGDGPVALSGLVGDDVLLAGRRSTIVFERDDEVRDRVFRLFATNHSPESQAGSLRDLLCCLPRVETGKRGAEDAEPEIGYRDVFRVLILQFIDAHSFDLRAVKKSCVHIARPDGRLIPFDTYNLWYRDGRERLLAEIREEIEPMSEPAVRP